MKLPRVNPDKYLVILPKGLLTQTKIFPLATWLFVALSILFSYFQFPIHRAGKKVYYEHPVRVDYAQSAQEYIFNTCASDQAKKFCEGLEEIPLSIYLFSDNLPKLSKASIRNRQHFSYISEELNSSKIAKTKPSLFQKKQDAKKVLNSFSKKFQLPSKANFRWKATFKSLFSSISWVHLFAYIVLLLFIAVPVEERLGPFFFSIAYVASGMVGNSAQAFLLPNSFYVVGSNAALAGILGCFLYFFSRNLVRLEINILGKLKTPVLLPTTAFAGLVAAGVLFFDGWSPYLQTQWLASFIGFTTGCLFASVHALLFPLPPYFSFPYELQYYDMTKKSLSQLDRVRVYLNWLHLSPLNLTAFRKLSKELSRSDQHTTVSREIKSFRRHYFYHLYTLHRKNQTFFESVPVDWLRFAPLGDREWRLKKWGADFEEKRDFINAFKIYFLILNEVGWQHKEYRSLLYKNYKKSTIHAHFNHSVAKLYNNHGPFRQLLIKRGEKIKDKSA